MESLGLQFSMNPYIKSKTIIWHHLNSNPPPTSKYNVKTMKNQFQGPQSPN